MASKQAGWKIYELQMGLLNHGDALWEPAPIYSYKRVKLGDVGYIRRGRFHLLFSAGCPLGSRQLGVDVPLTFEQLDVGPIIYSQPRLPGFLCTDTVKEIGGDLSASATTTASLEPGSSFSFELTERQGAALLTKYQTYREDIEFESAFEEYTKRYYESWVIFARNARHGNDIKPVLVTGIDMTRDFAMIAYSNNSARHSSEFKISVPLLASASATTWGTWHTQGLVHTNCGPQLCSPPSFPGTLDVPSGGPIHEYNQCVFIRYYTMRKRALMFPKVIKAAAGPHNLGSGSNYDESLPELMAQSSSSSGTGLDSSGGYMTDDYSSPVTNHEQELEVFHNPSSEEDTFDIVADYVFGNSEAEAVLIHHRDITHLRESMPGSKLSETLSQRQPLVEVSRDRVGRLVHQGYQLAVTSPWNISPRRHYYTEYSKPCCLLHCGTLIPMAPSAAYASGGMSLIEFNLDGSIGCGIRIVDVLNGNIEGLVGRDDIVVFNPDRGSIRLKIEFLGYESFMKKLNTPTCDFSMEKLARSVCRQVAAVIASSPKPFSSPPHGLPKAGAQLNGGDLFGPGGVVIEQLVLVSIKRVSFGCWVPCLRLVADYTDA